MKSLAALLFVFFIVFQVDAQNIIPTPESVEKMEGVFSFSKKNTLVFDKNGKQTAEFLILQFAKKQVQLTKNSSKADIVFKTIDDKTIGSEGYFLEVNQTQIIISANTETGLFYGVQTLLQLLPAEVVVGKKLLVGTKISCLKVTDKPKYTYRATRLSEMSNIIGKMKC